jgi:hypothetical protein
MQILIRLGLRRVMHRRFGGSLLNLDNEQLLQAAIADPVAFASCLQCVFGNPLRGFRRWLWSGSPPAMFRHQCSRTSFGHEPTDGDAVSGDHDGLSVLNWLPAGRRSCGLLESQAGVATHEHGWPLARLFRYRQMSMHVAVKCRC